MENHVLVLPWGKEELSLALPNDERFFMYFALQAMRHCRLLVYAPTVPADQRAGLPFVEFVDAPEEAVQKAACSVSNSAKALVFPHGGMTYPILSGRGPQDDTH